ncbi:ThiF family adenylyltransferase [Paenibacillus sp. CAU 1782]
MEQSRYARQIRFGAIGNSGQSKLGASKVAIVGLGALGSVIAQHIVRSGVGYVRVIDRDYVDWTNLQRQMLYTEKDATDMMPKAEAAAERLRSINSTIQLEAHVSDVTASNVEELLGGVDLVVDGSDNFAIRYLINDFCVKHNIPWIYGGATGSNGMTMTVLPGKTPCYVCLFPSAPAPGTADTCETAGILSPVVDMIGSLQSMEAIKLLTGNTDALHGGLLQIDMWRNGWMPMAIAKARREDCPCCGKRKFPYLDNNDAAPAAAALCGRQSVHLTPASPMELDLGAMADRLSSSGAVTLNRFLLKVELPGNLSFVLFRDGRAIIQGIEDLARARYIYAECLGI